MSSKPTNPARQLPKRDSPLAAFMVADGYYYDNRTGLVQQLKTPDEQTTD